MSVGRTHREVPREPPMHGGYTFLNVVPDPLAALDRAAEKAVTTTAALTALLADNECAHGALAVDPVKPAECHCFDAPAPKRAASNGKAIGNFRTADGAMQKILCACGRTWTRRAVRGRVPKCPTCRGAAAAPPSPPKES